MAAFFIIGEQKTRPGVYFRYENWGLPNVAGVDDGKCAAVFRSNWGPLGKAVALEASEDISKLYGDGGANTDANKAFEPFSTGDGNAFNTGDSGAFNVPTPVNVNTLAVPKEQFRGGATLVYGVRLGIGGTQGQYQIQDADGTAVVMLTLKYAGSRQLSITIRPTLDDPDISELLILEDTVELERLEFPNKDGEDNVAALLAAWQESELALTSNYYNLRVLPDTDSTKAIATIDQVAIPAGTNPVVNVAAYSAAFEILESQRWNVLAIDTTDTGVQSLMQLFLNRIYKAGKFVQGVIGEDRTVPFETRLLHASAYNDYQIVYVGNGFTDISGNVYEGWLAAARISGLIAGTPSNDSITHLAITGATDLLQPMTNNQYERAIKAGMLTFSTSAENTVWVEQGINTLVLPGTKEDNGWKKIKRVKIRFELFQRINDTVEVLVGRINNDPDGRMTVIQASNGVCNAMMAEKKLLAGAHVELDPDNAPKGDSAWFLVYADDIDALEKMYFAFKFRYAPEV